MSNEERIIAQLTKDIAGTGKVVLETASTILQQLNLYIITDMRRDELVVVVDTNEDSALSRAMHSLTGMGDMTDDKMSELVTETFPLLDATLLVL